MSSSHNNNHGHTNHDQTHADGEHHSLPLKVYFYVFATLIVLTVLTVFVAQFHFGAFNGVVAMSIALLKATLVGMYFMHLKYDNKLYATILVGSVCFLILFWFFSYFDFITRAIETSPL